MPARGWATLLDACRPDLRAVRLARGCPCRLGLPPADRIAQRRTSRWHHARGSGCPTPRGNVRLLRTDGFLRSLSRGRIETSTPIVTSRPDVFSAEAAAIPVLAAGVARRAGMIATMS